MIGMHNVRRVWLTRSVTCERLVGNSRRRQGFGFILRRSMSGHAGFCLDKQLANGYEQTASTFKQFENTISLG